MARSSKKNQHQRKPVISVQVINVTCPCGGACENENGSTMIEYFHKIIWCQECLTQYEVPESAFQKTFLLSSSDLLAEFNAIPSYVERFCDGREQF